MGHACSLSRIVCVAMYGCLPAMLVDGSEFPLLEPSLNDVRPELQFDAPTIPFNC